MARQKGTRPAPSRAVTNCRTESRFASTRRGETQAMPSSKTCTVAPRSPGQEVSGNAAAPKTIDRQANFRVGETVRRGFAGLSTRASRYHLQHDRGRTRRSGSVLGNVSPDIGGRFGCRKGIMDTIRSVFIHRRLLRKTRRSARRSEIRRTGPIGDLAPGTAVKKWPAPTETRSSIRRPRHRQNTRT